METVGKNLARQQRDLELLESEMKLLFEQGRVREAETLQPKIDLLRGELTSAANNRIAALRKKRNFLSVDFETENKRAESPDPKNLDERMIVGPGTGAKRVLFKATKNIMSKVVESQLGRRVINSHLGTTGNILVDCLKSVTTTHAGRRIAKHHKQVVYKMVLKAKLHVDEGLISDESASSLISAWHDLLPLLLKNLDPANASPNIAELRVQMKRTFELLVKLYARNMTNKNVKLLTETCEFYGSKEFLQTFLELAECQEHRATMFNCLNKIKVNLDDPRSQEIDEEIVIVTLYNDKYSSVVAAVERFWEKVVKRKTEVGIAIATRFFDEHPELQQYFGADASIEYCGEKLMEKLHLIFAYCGRMEQSVINMKEVAPVHIENKIPITSLDQLWDALDFVMRQLFKKEYNRLVRTSCRSIYGHLTDVLRGHYPVQDIQEEEKVGDNRYQLLEALWKDVFKHSVELTAVLFDHLFNEVPQYEDLFSGDVGDQKKMVDGMMDVFSRAIEKHKTKTFESMSEELKALAVMHKRLGVPEEGLEHIWDSLDMALLLCFDKHFTPLLRCTLREIFWDIKIAMKVAYE